MPDLSPVALSKAAILVLSLPCALSLLATAVELFIACFVLGTGRHCFSLSFPNFPNLELEARLCVGGNISPGTTRVTPWQCVVMGSIPETHSFQGLQPCSSQSDG